MAGVDVFVGCIRDGILSNRTVQDRKIAEDLNGFRVILPKGPCRYRKCLLKTILCLHMVTIDFRMLPRLFKLCAVSR